MTFKSESPFFYLKRERETFMNIECQILDRIHIITSKDEINLNLTEM